MDAALALQKRAQYISRHDNPQFHALNAGSSTIKALGAEVDRLEAAIVHLVPGIRHIDLVPSSSICNATILTHCGASHKHNTLRARLTRPDRVLSQMPSFAPACLPSPCDLQPWPVNLHLHSSQLVACACAITAAHFPSD